MKRTEAQLVQDVAIPGLIREYKRRIQQRIRQVSDQVEFHEDTTWGPLVAEARAFDANPGTANITLLVAAAREAGTPLPQFVTNILDTALTVDDAVGSLLAEQADGIAQITACTTAEDVRQVRQALGL